jgi:hypothetical protein
MADDLIGAKNRVRIAGSGFTVFTWDNKPILFARMIRHDSPVPVGGGTAAIHPMDEPYPVELITPMAAGMGTITLELFELYGAQVWERLASYLGGDPAGTSTLASDSVNGSGKGPVDIVGIFNAVANTPKPIQIVKYVKPPAIRGKTMKPYTEEYHNCVISQVEDSETIEVGAMEIIKRVTVNYTYMTRGGRNPMRDRRSSNLGGVTPYDSSTTSFG